MRVLRICRLLTGLFSVLAAASALAQPSPTTIPVTGNLSQIAGSPQPYAGLSIQLQNCPSPVAVTGYSVIVQQTIQLRANASGVVNATIWPNDEITCNGTTGNSMYATVPIVNGVPSGTPQCYQVTSTQGTWNLNTQQPIACTQSPPNPQDAQYRNLNVTGCLSVNGNACGTGQYLPTAGGALTGPLVGTTAQFTGINSVYYPTTLAQLQANVTSCGSNPCTISVNTAIAVTGNYTIPANVSLQFANGGQLQPAGGTTLTVSKAPLNPAIQIFGGGGTVTGLPYVRPEWLGPSATIANAVAALSASSGGIVDLSVATYVAGGVNITTPNVQIAGAGMPKFNSSYTALTGGTIIRGAVLAHQGADNLVIRDLGVDDGSAYVSGGGSVSDAIAIYNSGQTVGAPQLQNTLIKNVACLGSTPTAAYHCMLVENVNNAYINNVQAAGNTHGLVLKGTNSTIDGVWAAGHSTDSVDIKSDPYAANNNDVVRNIKMTYLATPGDTGPLVINAEMVSSAGLSNYNITVSQVEAVGVGSSTNFEALQLFSQGNTFPVADINISDVSIDWPGGSPSGYACVVNSGSVARVNMHGIICKNYYYAVYPAFPDASTNDFVLTGSQFSNITGPSAIQTNGRWTVVGNLFNNITGNAVLAQTGVVALGDNTCNACGAYYNKVSGSFDFDFRAYTDNTIAQAVSPAVIGSVQSMTSGQLVLNFWNTFNGTPICSATPVSANAPGTPAPTLWINSVNASGVTFNASSATFNGQIHWQCIGQFN